MKRYIHASTTDNAKKIPTEQEYFAEVELKDMPVFDYLRTIKSMMGKALTIPNTRNELGKTNNYAAEDKCIHFREEGSDFRTYAVPYTEYDRMLHVYRVYTYPVTVYDNGDFRIGYKGKIRSVGKFADSTIAKDVYKARSSWY